MTIAIIGTGFVGVVTGVVYASLGNQVIGLDIDEAKVESLRQGEVPFFEPGLEEMLQKEQQEGRLRFTTDYEEAVSNSEIIVVAVGTPSTQDGRVNLEYVYSACETAAKHLMEGAILVIKSTVPPGTLDKVQEIISSKTNVNFELASVPEFLREGVAVEDTLNPDRIVIGAESDYVYEKLAELHRPLNAPIVRVSPVSAQMAKYAANAYLATRITFINQIADLCESAGASIEDVIEAIGFDKRIGDHYWYPGFGYGGSCFPKDVKELAHYSRSIGLDQNLLNQLDRLNEERIPRLLSKFSDWLGGFEGKTVAVLGLSFKPNTNDMREAPSTKIIPLLLEKGAIVRGFDPKALKEAGQVLRSHQNLSLVDSIELACSNADVIFSLIEWKEIVNFDFSKVRDEQKQQWFIDARNQHDPEKIKQIGFAYHGVGRK